MTLPPRERRRAALAALLSALALALGGCTGTFETLPPLLLVTSLVEGEIAQLALIEDTFLTEDEIEGRFVFLEESRRDLPAPAVAFDLVDRRGDRTSLAVLSRGPGPDFTAFLSLFQVTDIDPSDPSTFAETSRRDLSAILLDEVGVAAPCLTEVAMSADGRYAALFEDRSACVPGDTLRALYVIDLDTDGVVKTIDTEPVLPAGLYLDQETDLVYYLSDAVGEADLRSFELPDERIETVATVTGNEQIDLAPVQQSVLLALEPDAFEAVDLDDPGATRTPVDTTSGSLALIDDDLGIVPEVLILGSSRFTVHTTISDSEEQALTVTAVSGTLEPTQQFVYLLETGAIRLFDLLRYEGSFSGTVERFAIAELTSPGLITWVRATPLGEAP